MSRLRAAFIPSLAYRLRDIQKGFLMKNIELTVEGDKLIIVVDLKQEFGLSSSGKSITVASTEGNVSVPQREDIKIGLNIYKPRPRS
jgi:hypothetical protein